FANHTDDNVVSTAATINASSNWHGTADPTAVGDLIDGDIDYTPWFASGTDADPGTPGWQGDYSTLVIDDDSRQVGGVSIFQEGVDLADASAAATLKASANPKVQIADGTYSTATLNKPLDIEPLGTGASVDNLIVEDNVNLIGNDLTVNTLLDITAGAIDATGGPKVVLGPNATVEEDEGGELVVGTTEVTRDAPPGQVQDFGGVGFSIAPFGNDPGTVEVERVVGTAQTVDGTSSILRYYDVTPTNNGGLIATIIFEYQDAELNGLAEADLELFRSEDGGTTWIDAGGTVDAAANTITVGGVDRLSRWTAAVPDPLPVELADFAATVDGETVYLTWNTLSEQSNAGFEVQMRSDAAETWNVLGFVDGFGDTNELQSYAFEATNLPFGALQFRLKQLDYDGQFEYSPVVETVVELAESFVIEAAYPNPFNPQATVRFAVAREQQVTVDLFSVLGQRVATLYDGVAPANQMQVVRIDGSELPSGTYLIRTSGEAFAETQRVVLLK
ncbi:MAG: T9SS type A sorting domain-containing protein, partial [Bacteroidota bacterium]